MHFEPPSRGSRIGTTLRERSISSNGSDKSRMTHVYVSAAAGSRPMRSTPLGRRPEARAVLERLRAEFPENTRLRGRLARADTNATTNNHP